MPPKNKDVRPPEWKKAIECCKPRLLDEIAGRKVFAMGKRALQATAGKSSVKQWRGYPLGDVYPAFAGYVPRVNPALIPIMNIDINRAWRWATGKLPEWDWGPIQIEPGPKQRALITRMRESGLPLGVDVETAGINPRNSPLLCVGVGTRECAVSVNWHPMANNYRETKMLISLIKSDQSKVMQNAQHDILTLRHNAIPVGGECFDTLLAHHIVAPQLPHDLGTIASCYFPAPKWKTIFGASTDEKGLAVYTKRPGAELRLYNAKDALMTARLKDELEKTLSRTHRSGTQLQVIHDLAEVAMEMRDHGVVAVEENRKKHELALLDVIRVQEEEFAALGLTHVLVGKKKYRKTRRNDERGKNERCETYHFSTAVYAGPYRLGANGQHRDLNILFFDVWGCKPRDFSEDTHKPKLDRDLLSYECGNFDPLIARTARQILQYREATKLLSTYVRGLPVEADGIVRPTFKVYGTKTGRWSSAQPNAQNIPAKMRDMFASRPGRYLCAADYSQLELRITAAMSGDPLLLEWFRLGRDVHREVAASVFGCTPEQVTLPQRALTKGVVYGMNYGAGAETIWRTLLIKFPKVKLKMVENIIKDWYKQHPKLRDLQQDLLDIAAKTLYVEAPFSGRREYFHDGRIEPTKVFNFPIQGTAGDIMNESILHLDKLCAAEKDTNIIFQVHDEIVIEGPDPARMFDMLKESMQRDLEMNNYTVAMPVDVDIGLNWGLMVKEIAREDIPRILRELG